ncbi:putative transferase At1g60990, chloroplastic [Diospyros lotus]|uniref:putative transferase At1g60990, chloroplastic n=1 Tax=Diospyros lotus TaxID=55363 RepID=UPI002251384C|nr:putative transferase At1g60990, chloroplastic [Diospyros lotus]
MFINFTQIPNNRPKISRVPFGGREKRFQAPEPETMSSAGYFPACSSSSSSFNYLLPQIPKSASSPKPLSLSGRISHRNYTFRTTRNFSTSSSSAHFDLSPPPIDHDLLETVTVAGAKLSEDGIIETFNNDELALDAVDTGVVVVDLSHYGRIRVCGEDRIQFLHNQTTANFECLHEGQGCDTVFVTPTARTIDIAHAWIMRNAITLVVSPVTCKSICDMLRKYIFLADKVEIQDITKQTCLFVLVGPRSKNVMEDLNLGDLVGQPYGSHRHYTVNGMPITVAVGNIISEEGFSLLMSPGAAGSVWTTLLSQGTIPMGSNAWETLRIFQGRPAPGKELTDEYNVLEAGLWNAISLDKGCYKGQETISRLITYDGIKQRLLGIRLSSPAEPGSPITVGAKKVGKLTSYVVGTNETEHFGLGYIKRKAASEGDTVTVGDNVVGTVVEVPFLARQRPPLSKNTNS